ncbi:DEAD/DEAH box helicase [Pseudomonas sp. 2FE]|uniref:DEAD/DEAH box helicase n=1 Tax=Pseudomonas sp. 2FE TaxID=2502190 RepID=UPI0010F5DCFC|nr:DEAD/DEAH box helicase [Pseudomonas sp. 2FE]
MRSTLEQLRQHAWTDEFDRGALTRGQEYAQQKRVVILACEDNLIRANCRGSGTQRYEQQILLGTPGAPLIGRCSCPVGYNCKHCVAVLLHLLQQSPSQTATAPATPKLSGSLQSWLQQLPKADRPDANAYPPGELSRLYYQLVPDLLIELYKVRLRKDGSLAEIKPYSSLREAIQREPRFLLPLDLRIARLAYSSKDNSYRYDNRLDLNGASGGEILARLLETGRLFLDLEDDRPLRSGEPRQAHFTWQSMRNGDYCPTWKVDGGTNLEVLTAVEPLHYLDLETGQIGPLQHDLPARLASHLSQAPSVSATEVELFSLSLHELAPQVPLPCAPQERLLDDLLPVPHLSLGSHLFSGYQPRTGRISSEYQHRAGLSFVYAGARVHGKKVAAGERIRSVDRAEILSIARQPKAERALRQQLERLGMRPALRQSQALPKDSAEMFDLASEADWLDFAQQGLPQLRKQGWQIEIKPGFVFDLTPVDAWYAELDESPEREWFDLALGILVDGQRISLLPVLLKLIRQNPQLLSASTLQLRSDDELLHLKLDSVRQEDGRPLQVVLPLGRLKSILATLGELYLRDQPLSPTLRLSAPDAARLSALDALDLEWQGGERLREFAHRLRDCQSVAASAPPGLQAELRPYQLEGLGWMQTLRELEAGGILGDDMGLGKTLQTLAHLLTEKHAGRLDRPALAVMPTSLIPNWQDEAARFAPDLRVLALHGPGRQKDFARLADFDLLLTTYALLPRDLERLKAQPLHLLILDEAQYIKNPASKAAQAACQLDARQRLCLSGTPLENHLGELWSLYHFLMPGWLGDSKGFTRDYRTPIEKHGDSARLAHLNARIKPFLLRRKKDQVAKELPAKSEIVHWVELSEAQRDLYETVRLAMDKKVREEIDRKGLARSQIVILEALLKLRQVCCDLRLVKSAVNPQKPRSGSSGKLDSLLEMLEELLAEGRRVLLFSQFTSMLALIEEELQRRDIAYVQITGETTDRRTPVQQFQSGAVPLFLISLKAGGTGLNLTAADTVIHYDPWWNPAAENQATDRAYRIGQDKPVFVYKLIARGTVEEKIQQLQQKKAALAAGVLESNGKGDWQLQPSDIDALFAPLPVG